MRGAAINTVAPKASDRLICSLIVFISAKPDSPSYTVGIMYSTYDALYMIAALVAAFGGIRIQSTAEEQNLRAFAPTCEAPHEQSEAAITSPAGTP